MSEPEDRTQRLPIVEQSASAGPGRSATAYRPVPEPKAVRPRAGRFWSSRRTPAALVALVVLGAAGLLLYDVASVRAGRPAMHWRHVLADNLATRPLGDIRFEVGAAVAMALGLWLILLALTPGLRSVLPMTTGGHRVRAGLERDAAALVLRDRAMEVSGVQSVRIRVKRSRVVARARSHFRELEDVRTDLNTALGAGIAELGLASPPRLSVHVGRPAGKG
ncbi:DUF6286 domain-containing protein [Streptomyces sp. NPDC051320]|uniref:DUF6286 domain-containing protein n=1 Tax=Streptomyces sp. NPDC051320 TaxID=3154644 RepID=UPI003412FD6F